VKPRNPKPAVTDTETSVVVIPEVRPVKLTYSQVGKLFNFVQHDPRIKSSKSSIIRLNRDRGQAAVAYTKSFPYNSYYEFNATFDFSRLTGPAELGICTERLPTTGDVWLGDQASTLSWYNNGGGKGSFFIKGVKKRANGPTFDNGDTVTFGYMPYTGDLLIMKNGLKVATTKFKVRDAREFMFCAVLTSPNDSLYLARWSMLDYTGTDRVA
jgi:hypothetical protein